MLSFEGLSVSGCGVPIVDDLHLRFPERGVAVLLGPSGCGKTTLLRCTIRTDEDDPDLRCRGRVLLDGVDVRAKGYPATRLRQRIGLVMQRPMPFPGTALQNVAFALRCTTDLSPGEIQRRSLEALEHVGLEPQHHHARAAQLSGGQLKRLAIARSCALRPDVLLMDEPSNGLDPLSVARLEKLVRHLAEERLVVVVTHDVGMTRRIADQVCFLWPYPGGSRLVESGSVAQVLDAPRATETRLFVGAAHQGAAALDSLGMELCDVEAEECRPRTLAIGAAEAAGQRNDHPHSDRGQGCGDSCGGDSQTEEQYPHEPEVRGPQFPGEQPLRRSHPRIEVVHQSRAAAGGDASGCDSGCGRSAV